VAEGLGAGLASVAEGLGEGAVVSAGLGEGVGVSAKAIEEDASEPTREMSKTNT